MRRITSACLEQTIRFETLNGENPQQELKIYLEQLQRKHIKYELVDQYAGDDGKYYIKIKKQYNSYKTDGYID
jgi:RNA binding exosome subunit